MGMELKFIIRINCIVKGQHVTVIKMRLHRVISIQIRFPYQTLFLMNPIHEIAWHYNINFVSRCMIGKVNWDKSQNKYLSVTLKKCKIRYVCFTNLNFSLEFCLSYIFLYNRFLFLNVQFIDIFVTSPGMFGIWPL